MEALEVFVFGVKTPQGLVTRTLPCPACKSANTSLTGVFGQNLDTFEFKCPGCNTSFRKKVASN